MSDVDPLPATATYRDIARDAVLRNRITVNTARRAVYDVDALVTAAGNVLEYLDGMDIPYRDRHRPLIALDDALAPFRPTTEEAT